MAQREDLELEGGPCSEGSPEGGKDDGHQSLTIEELEVLMRQVAVIAGATGRPLA